MKLEFIHIAINVKARESPCDCDRLLGEWKSFILAYFS